MEFCISNIHDDPIEATTWGRYVNGEHVAYCDECAAMGEAYQLFTPDNQ